MSLDFATLTLNRTIACKPKSLFALLVDPVARGKWGAPDDTSVIVVDEADIREGGHELSRCGSKEDPYFTTRSTFHVVRPDECLINTETLTVQGEMLSVALVSFEIAPTDTGSTLDVTLQITSLSGPDTVGEYRTGWTAALDNLKNLAQGT